MTYQLELPDDHLRNIAEKSIQTWKDHFVGIISGIAATFPNAPVVTSCAASRTPDTTPTTG